MALECEFRSDLKELKLLEEDVIRQVLAGRLNPATENKMEELVRYEWVVHGPPKWPQDLPELARFEEAYRSIIKKIVRSEAARAGITPLPVQRARKKGASNTEARPTKRRKVADKQVTSEDCSPLAQGFIVEEDIERLPSSEELGLTPSSAPALEELLDDGVTAATPGIKTPNESAQATNPSLTSPSALEAIQPAQKPKDSATTTIQDKPKPELSTKTSTPSQDNPSSTQPSTPTPTVRERRLQDFKVLIISTETAATAYMTVSDLVPATARGEPDIFDFVELDLLFAAMQGQMPGNHKGKGLEFRGSDVLSVKDSISLRFAIKEAYYAGWDTAKLCFAATMG